MAARRAEVGIDVNDSIVAAASESSTGSADGNGVGCVDHRVSPGGNRGDTWQAQSGHGCGSETATPQEVDMGACDGAVVTREHAGAVCRISAEAEVAIEPNGALDAVEDELGVLVKVRGTWASAIDPADSSIGSFELAPVAMRSGQRA